MSPKDLVKAFYDSDIANDANVIPQFFHKDCELHWSSSKGFTLLKYNDIVGFFEIARQSYDALRFEFTHFIEADDKVVTRHTLYANTIENLDDEMVLARYFTIWEVKDDKLYRAYEITQQADQNHTKAMDSYAERKI